MNFEGPTDSLPAELPAIAAAMLKRLESELPPGLAYHGAPHTGEVLVQAWKLGRSEGLSGRELELLLIAAAFHDSGYLQRRESHEELSAAFAVEAMRAAGGYTSSEILQVQDAILDTRMLQGEDGIIWAARTALSPCLLDADVANFGGDDFFVKMAQVAQELGAVCDRSYLERVEAMLGAHRWHTATAAMLWDDKKRANRERLKAVIAKAI